MLQQTVLRLNGLPDSGAPDHQQLAAQNLMRLNAEQQIAIRELTTDLIGPDAHIWLFGSRADDQRRGGDIDVLVEVDRPLDDRVLLATRLAARLERRFQGLPVDVVLKDSITLSQPIHEIAKRTGIPL